MDLSEESYGWLNFDCLVWSSGATAKELSVELYGWLNFDFLVVSS